MQSLPHPGTIPKRHISPETVLSTDSPIISSSRPRVLSGMRPTGKLHLGNYMGALANWVKLQQDYECYFFIADYHALTTDYADPSRLKWNTLDVALDWLAAGLDPEKSTIFIQSHVPQHAELHLLFSMITPLGWLERVPTYKEQQENIKGKDLTTYGFLGYPLLQSADILLYQPQFVPVGQDQVAHVELTREVARRFNSMYRKEDRPDVFPEPEVLLTPSPKLTGTDGRKMSKSYDNTIGLTEVPESATKKILGMSTNGQRIRQTDPGDPDLCPVADLHAVFSAPEMVSEIRLGCRTASISCSACKAKAAESVSEALAPIHERRQQRMSNIDETWDLLVRGSKDAAKQAEATMQHVREVCGVSRGPESSWVTPYRSSMGTRDIRDLQQYKQKWDEPFTERAAWLRKYWMDEVVPRDIALSQESNRVFASRDRQLEEPLLSAKKKRVFVTTSRDYVIEDQWKFEIPSKSYEIWTLLCWRKRDYKLKDFVVPQKYYSQFIAIAKRELPKDEKIPIVVTRTAGNRYQLSINGQTSRDITDLSDNYDPFR